MASVAKREWTHKGVKQEAWVVRYSDQGGKRRLKTFEKKKDADKYRTKVETELGDGTHIPRSEAATVAAVCDLFLAHTADRLRDGRIGRSHEMHLRTAVNKNIVPFLGSRLITELKPSVVEDFYQWMRREENLSIGSAKQRISNLRLVEEFAFKRGMIKSRPVLEGQKELRSLTNDRIRTFTAEEAAALLRAAGVRREGGKRRPAAMLNCMVNLAGFCGLRIGEVLGLSLDNILLDDRVLQVRRNLTIYGELKGPKTRAGMRDVPMPEHVAALLREWIATYAVPNPDGLIFRTASGEQLTYTNFHRQMWRPLLKRAGLDAEGGRRFNFHALRHFAASWMIEYGLPVTEVASLLGHSKFDMTLQTYAHPVVGGHRRQAVMEGMAQGLLTLPSPVATTRARQHGLTIRNV